ncbi:hypothetical protein, partial [Corynebacterium diphtheriae]|uniref:hypothetical protein n=1 Tax=Corynebacterium diphtheriae TaxID=1717 RepID=UPI00280A8314
AEQDEYSFYTQQLANVITARSTQHDIAESTPNDNCLFFFFFFFFFFSFIDFFFFCFNKKKKKKKKKVANEASRVSKNRGVVSGQQHRLCRLGCPVAV